MNSQNYQDQQILYEQDINKIKQFLNKVRPSMVLNHLTQQQLKSYFQMVVKQEKEQKQAEMLKNQPLGSLVNKKKKIKLTAKQKRQILIKELPSQRKNIEDLDENQLQQLYQQFLLIQTKTNSTQDCEYIQPNSKNKVQDISLKQIQNMNLNLKESIEPQQYVIQNQQKSILPHISKIKKQLLHFLPQSTNQINSLNDKQLIQLYYAEGPFEEEQERKISSSSFDRNYAKQKNMYQSQVTPVNSSIEHSSPKIHKKQNMNTKIWSQQHTEGGQIRAKTYMMMLTQYQTPKKKKYPQSKPFDQCTCQCCKNNTYKKMFLEMVALLSNKK